MRCIYKYRLPHFWIQSVEMPKGSRVVHVGQQDGTPTLWVLVDTEAPTCSRLFKVMGTGGEIDKTDVYLGTCFVDRFVWHIFEEGAGP